MTRKLRIILFSLTTGMALINTAAADSPPYSPDYIAKVLNWVPETSKCNACAGHYAEPKILIENPNPKDPNQSPSEITASGPSTFSSHGVSILTQNVVMTQPGRIVNADKAYIYRNTKTGKINHIHLVGHVKLSELGKLIVAKIADYYTETHEWHFNNPIYHVTEKKINGISVNKFHYEAFGTSESAYKDKDGVIHLRNANYSTCSPQNPTWQLYSKKLILDHNKGRGYAYNVVIRAKRVPIFYFPYFNFPLDNRRQSGFLTPTLGSSQQRGFETDLPFYWNMAPNFDMLITPRLMTKRGIGISDWFRYLFPNSTGRIYEAINPDDLYFHRYVANTILQNRNTLSLAPYVTTLNSYRNQYFRGFYSVENNTQLTSALSTSLQLNYVTDNYYLRDYGTTFNDIFANQLQNEFRVNYEKKHWTATAFVQAYQTLHLIDQYPGVEDQYQRLPEIDIESHYPRIFRHFDFESASQYVNFAYSSIYPPALTFQKPIGQRYHGASTLSLPMIFASGYITPAITNDSTIYDAESSTLAPNIPRTQIQAFRDLPIVDIDSGLYFDRDFLNGKYRQTFEPRLFYLYVPYQNQNNLPFFDTQLLPFTYDQLYATNRLSGFDRLENANQISLGALTRILSSKTGTEILNAGIGMEYYFQAPQVPILNALGQTVLPFRGSISPLVGEITYYPWANWSITGNVAWDFVNQSLNNANTTITYSGPGNRTLTLSYLFASNNLGVIPQNLNTTQISQLISGGVSWPISRSINVLGYEYYDLTNNRQQNLFGGVEYSTCCWAIRGVVSRSLFSSNVVGTGAGMRVTNHYQTVYYLQLLLKGFGDLGNGDPSTLLTSTIPGYVDPFKSK